MPSSSQLTTPIVADAEKIPGLSLLEVESIDLFIGFVRLLGMPKSVGELYGLLFVSPQPLSLEKLMERLQMSRGAASQGLKLLRSFGAVKTAYVAGERRDHYVADLDVSRFASAFIKEEIQPFLDDGVLRLQRMDDFSATMPSPMRGVMSDRLEKLKHWQEKGQAMLPWLLKFLVA